MKTLWNFILLMAVLCLAGCKEEEEEVNSFKEQAEALKEALCFNGKYVEREFENTLFKEHHGKAVSKQKDYTFTPDGRGKLTTYFINQTAVGYTTSEQELTWSVSDEPPLQLKIRIGDMETFVLSDVSVNKDFLTSSSTDWNKELIAPKNLSAEDILSYSVEDLYMWQERRDLQMFVFTVPCVLTVKTKDGTMRFIRDFYGKNASGFPHGFFDKVGSEYVLSPGDYEADIYFRVNPSSPIFYEIDRRQEKLDFKTTTTNGSVRYNFPVGRISEDHSLTFIDSKKDYQLD